jgi:hypothetical protein
MKEAEMARIAELMDEALAHRAEPDALARVRAQVDELVERFPLYPELRAGSGLRVQGSGQLPRAHSPQP